MLNSFINYGFGEAGLVGLNRVQNYMKLLYISDITEDNDKTIKMSIFNGLQDHSTKKYR